MAGVVEKLRDASGYDPDAWGSIDDLIAYMYALEDLVGRIDEIATENAHGRCSAADVCSQLFTDGFGDAA